MTRTLRKAALWALGLLALLGLALRGRLPPPTPARHGPFDVSAGQGSELVELEVEPGVFLRGLFIPADEGAPVVLHLQEAGHSCFQSEWWQIPSNLLLADRLADIGFASLVIDYAGVGGSDGEPSIRNLARDAQAMWIEALRRSQGDAERVVLHATSLGTLAAASMLQSGARPAGVLAVAPVMHDSALRLAARELRGALAGWAAGWFYAPLGSVDLRDVCRPDGPPLLVVAGSLDTFTEPAERAQLRGLLERAGGAWVERELDHYALARQILEPHEEELRFLERVQACTPPVEERVARVLAGLPAELAERFRRDPEALERLRSVARLAYEDDPLRVAAAAWPPNPDPALVARLQWTCPQRSRRVSIQTQDWTTSFNEPWSFELLSLIYDLDDPAGPLPTEFLERCRLAEAELATIERAVASRGRGLEPTEFYWFSDPTCDCKLLWSGLGAERLPAPDRARRFARLLLKLAGIPERVVRDATGRPVLEVLDEIVWRPFDFDADPFPLDAGSPRDPAGR